MWGGKKEFNINEIPLKYVSIIYIVHFHFNNSYKIYVTKTHLVRMLVAITLDSVGFIGFLLFMSPQVHTSNKTQIEFLERGSRKLFDFRLGKKFIVDEWEIYYP